MKHLHTSSSDPSSPHDISIQLLPKVRDGLQLMPASQPGEHLIVRTDGKAVRMANRFIGILLACDGTRSDRNVAELVSDPQTPPIPESLVTKLVEQMTANGITERVPRVRPVVVLGDPHHSCRACGLSCEHHIVGPLAPDFIHQLTLNHRLLTPLHPRLLSQPPLMPMPDGQGYALNVVNNRCVFLDDDKLCLLHKHLGEDTKPLTCRTFPIVVIAAEDEIRVGLQPTCYELHQSFTDGPPLAETPILNGSATQRPPSPQTSLPPIPGAPASTPCDEEAILIAWASDPDVTPIEFFARLLGLPSQTPSRQALPTHTVQRLLHLLSTVGHTFVDADETSDSLYALRLHTLLAGLCALNNSPHLAPLLLPPLHTRFAMFTIAQGLFSRCGAQLPSPRFAALTLTLGVFAAALTSPPNLPDTIDDAFAHTLVAWNRCFLLTGHDAETLFGVPFDLTASLFDDTEDLP